MLELLLSSAYFVVVVPISLLVSAALYIVSGVVFSGIAKRRGFKNPWLAWVPVAYAWLYGAIADQYRQEAYGKVSNRKTVLLWLTVASLVCGILPPWIFAIPVGVVWSVFMYIALYDIYRSCDPDKALLYLLLSIFTLGLAQPVCLLLCWKKDLGMPSMQTAETMEEAEVNVISAEETETVPEAE